MNPKQSYTGGHAATHPTTPNTKNHGVIEQQPSDATLWNLLKLLSVAITVVIFSLIGFVAGSIWEIYPELSRLDIRIPPDTLVIAIAVGLVLSILVWKSYFHAGIVTGAILAAATLWWASSDGHSTQWGLSPDITSKQKPITDKKSVRQKKPYIAPHMRRRLCLEDGTDIDRIECRKQGSNKRRYTWATL